MLTAARKRVDGKFEIDSFSGRGSYVVDLVAGTCSCPHYVKRLAGTNRGPCKHICSVASQAPRIELIEKARRCTDEMIAELLPKYATDPDVGGALRVAREERRQELLQADYDAHMRSIFA